MSRSIRYPVPSSIQSKKSRQAAAMQNAANNYDSDRAASADKQNDLCKRYAARERDVKRDSERDTIMKQSSAGKTRAVIDENIAANDRYAASCSADGRRTYDEKCAPGGGRATGKMGAVVCEASAIGRISTNDSPSAIDRISAVDRVGVNAVDRAGAIAKVNSADKAITETEAIAEAASKPMPCTAYSSRTPDTTKIDGIDPSPTASKTFSAKIHMIPVGLIRPNPSQPRKSFDDDAILRLSESIRQYGILQPLSVRASCSLPDDKLISGEIQLVGENQSYYEIIAGERRFRAAKLAGMTEVPCIILTVDSKKSAELAIIENIQREDLNIFEQAGAIASLIDIYKLTQEQIAGMLSVSQSYIANKLRILKLTSAERKLILESGLTERHARAILRIGDVNARIQALKMIITHEMNVSRTETYIEQLLVGDQNSQPASGKRKLILKDIRIFYNTIDRAIDTMERAGISVAKERRDGGDGVTELIIRISSKQPTTKRLPSERVKRSPIGIA